MMNQQQFEEPYYNPIPNYSVRIWEVLLVFSGALTLVGTASFMLGRQMLTNMFNPARAELIAQSMFEYEIPGGSVGVAGVNLRAKKIAIVNSRTNPPDITLFVSKVPIEKLNDENPLNLDVLLREAFQSEFTPVNSRIENKQLCGDTVSVYIQEGTQKSDNETTTIPIVKYMATITGSGIERNVHILAKGENANKKASDVFDSLQCRF
jgi:hypothetical protein